MISCEEYTKVRKDLFKKQILSMNRPPALVAIQVGNDKASSSYIRGKFKDSDEIGIDFTHVHMEEDSTQQELLTLIDELNEDPNIDGIIVQLPLPKEFNVRLVQERISKYKDVDGFRKDSAFKSCTPKGVMDWFAFNEVNLVGQDVVVIGRSEIVGKPLVNMLIDAGATVTCCNSKSKNIGFYTDTADIVISAVGKPKIFDFRYFSDVNIIVDVGINRNEDGKLCGDINTEHFDKFLPNVYVTPVPKGVGLLTRLALMDNTIHAYYLNGGK